jgi:pre-mRNA-splicing factor SYF2
MSETHGSLYRTADSLEYVHAGSNKPAPEAVDRMVADLENQLAKRKKHSRYRGEDNSADVTYINDKNMRFNKKIARAYDKFTEEIRDSFERGSAL